MRHTIGQEPPSSLVDKELVEQAKLGDKQAFDLLVQKYQFRILKLVNRYVNDPSESMDIAQESFIKAYRALDKFRGDSAFFTWLYRIAINTAKNHVVSQNRRMVEADVEVLDMEQSLLKTGIRNYSAPEKILMDTEVEKMINEVIEHLPKELKIAITLREIDGMSYDEIAHVMACPVGTVRSRIFRARETIERRMRAYLKG